MSKNMNKIVALGIICVVVYFFLQTKGYPGGVPGAPIILSPVPGTNYNVMDSIPVEWRLPPGVSQTAYRVCIGNADFSSISRDTGKTTGSSTATNITAPATAETHYLRVVYWDGSGVQSNPSTVMIKVSLIQVPVFSITPDKTFTAGYYGSFRLTFQNNAPYAIQNIQLMLVDDQGVFQGVYVYDTFVSNLALNRYCTRFAPRVNGIYTWTLPAGQSGDFECTVQVGSPTAGLHSLIWKVKFEAIDPSGPPPSLDIPWKVTIYG